MHEYHASRIPQSDRVGYWTKSVTETLFPLTAEIRDPGSFTGQLKTWDMGSIGLSYFMTGGVRYRREKQHLRRLNGEDILVSFSLATETRFVQNGLDLQFKKEEFILQRGGSTYEFGHSDANELMVLKVKADDLSRHVRSIDRFTPLVFDASQGIGRLLLDTLRSLPERLGQSDERLYPRLGGMVVGLLELALEGDHRVLSSSESTVQRAHLGRIEHYIRQNIQNPNLSADTIAVACGISVRYLHELFSRGGQSVGSWIRQLRLEAAKDQISDLSRKETIAEAAYRWGFGDQAQFSRHYKSFYGETPRETKAKALKSR